LTDPSELERLIEQGGQVAQQVQLPQELKRRCYMNTGWGVNRVSQVFPFPDGSPINDLTALFFEIAGEVFIFPLNDDARREMVKQLSGGIEVPKLHVQGGNNKGG
jgi:hypothetical protein